MSYFNYVSYAYYCRYSVYNIVDGARPNIAPSALHLNVFRLSYSTGVCTHVRTLSLLHGFAFSPLHTIKILDLA